MSTKLSNKCIHTSSFNLESNYAPRYSDRMARRR